MRRELEDPVEFAPGAVVGPDGRAADLPSACAAYERLIDAAGGVDLQVLGINTDGHVAFNEPGSSLSSRTRVRTLTSQTRADNARFFADPHDVPHHLVTQGLGTISQARHLLLLATEPRKAVGGLKLSAYYRQASPTSQRGRACDPQEGASAARSGLS